MSKNYMMNFLNSNRSSIEKNESDQQDDVIMLNESSNVNYPNEM